MQPSANGAEQSAGTDGQRLRASRRELLAMAVVGGAGLAGLASAPGASAASSSATGSEFLLTVMGTTDLHGNVLNWNYFTDAVYDDSASNDIGLAKVSTLVNAVREERGAAGCLLLDAGDTIQGTPLAYYYARIDPITQGATHPMAAAMNAMRYDAAALGNHEFNYGMPLLRAYQRQLGFPLLGANAVDWHTRTPVFRPYVIKRVPVPGQPDIKVGILGLVTPGVAIWDKANVEGKVRFRGIVDQAREYVPKLRRAGADVVVVSCHSGSTLSSSYGDALPFWENASGLMARKVPGIDAILVGHAHVEIPQMYVTNEVTGREVLLTEPLRWGMRLSVMDLKVRRVKGGWRVASATSTTLNANTVPADPAITAVVATAHRRVRRYVNSVVGTSTQAISAARSRVEDTAAIDLVNHVQGELLSEALAGTPDADRPVLSIAAPFNREAALPQGEVTVRDVAGLYIFDNTLLGVVLTGAQLKDYLEFSARYFHQVSGPGPYTPDEITNAPTDAAPGGTPDYNYDIVGGVTAPFSYDVDIAQPVGSRIKNLAYDGVSLDGSEVFSVAVNNYRQSGGGGFPHISTAPVIENRQVEIRQAIIEWVTREGEVDPAAFFMQEWRLTADGEPVIVT